MKKTFIKNDIMKYIIDNINNAEIIPEPYAYILIDNIMPSDILQHYK